MAEEVTATLVDIPLEEIFVDQEYNSRGKIVPFDVLDLAKSIEQDGVLQAITVEPWEDEKNPKIKFRVVAGNRRTIASRVAKKKTIPAIVKVGLEPSRRRLINLVENLHRKDLNIKEEAHGLTDFIDWGWNVKEIAEYIGQATRWVEIRMILLALPDDVQNVAAAGLLTQEQIRGMKGKPLAAIYESIKDIKDAKARGEKIKIKEKSDKEAVDNHVKKVRKRDEVFEMLMKIYDYMGAGMHTRAMSWCAGEISNYELLKSLEEWCEANPEKVKAEEPYTVPDGMKDEFLNRG